jgi:hypothetical protein
LQLGKTVFNVPSAHRLRGPLDVAKHGMKYKDHVLAKYKQRIASDPSYRKRINKNAKRHREQNKEKIAERRKQYYLKNRDALRIKEQLRYAENRDRCIVNNKIYRVKKYIQKAIEKNDSKKLQSLIVKLNDLYQQQAIIKTQQKSI